MDPIIILAFVIGAVGIALLVLVAVPSFFDSLGPTPHSEAIRGRRNALAFLATNPTDEQFHAAWSSACVDEELDNTDHGQAYVRAYKDVLRPYVVLYQNAP